MKSGRGWHDGAISAALALGVAASVAGLLSSGVRLAGEDGFYYFKIAQHLASGDGSTFDGLHRTNGYHPLWLLCLVPVFRLQRSPEAAMTAATLLQGFLLAATAPLVYLLARTRLAPLASGLAVLLWAGLAYGVALSGVEFALVGALVAAVALVLVRGFEGPPRPPPVAYAGMGVLLALATLARLDTALLAVLVATHLTHRAWAGSRGATRAAMLWVPVLAVGGAYLLINAALFGYPLPVSGLVKRLSSTQLLKQDPVYVREGWLAAKAVNVLRPVRHPLGAGMPTILAGGVLPVVLLSLTAVGARGRALTRWTAGFPEALRPVVAFAALQPLAYGLVYHGHYSYAPWYFAAQPLVAALLAAALAEALGRRLASAALVTEELVPAAACAALAVFLAFDAVRRYQGPAAEEGPLYVAARWARDNLGPEARIGTWNAGAIAYLSQRQVVNLDGIVNTVGYVQREQYDLCGYWRRTGITHLVDVFEAREGSTSMLGTTLPVSRYYAGCAKDLELIWSERIPGSPGWPKAFRVRLP